MSVSRPEPLPRPRLVLGYDDKLRVIAAVEWHEVTPAKPDTRDTAARWAAPWWAFARWLSRPRRDRRPW